MIDDGGDHSIEAFCDWLAQRLTIERQRVQPAARLVEDLGFDSLALYELAVAIDERRPGLELPAQHHPADLTVLDVHHYVTSPGPSGSA